MILTIKVHNFYDFISHILIIKYKYLKVNFLFPESITSRSDKAMQLKISWQEKMFQFEKMKNELTDRQVGLDSNQLYLYFFRLLYILYMVNIRSDMG